MQRESSNFQASATKIYNNNILFYFFLCSSKKSRDYCVNIKIILILIFMKTCEDFKYLNFFSIRPDQQPNLNRISKKINSLLNLCFLNIHRKWFSPEVRAVISNQINEENHEPIIYQIISYNNSAYHESHLKTILSIISIRNMKLFIFHSIYNVYKKYAFVE